MKTTLLSILITIFSTLSILAQKGAVQGVLINKNKEFLPGATVRIANSNLGMVTDLDGRFFIKDIPLGEHTLVVTYLGYKDFSQSIKLDTKETLDLGDLLLEEDGTTIGEVVVESRLERSSEFKAINLMKTSGSYVTVISSETMDKLPDRNIAEIVRRAAGVAMQRNYGEGSLINLRGTPVDWTSVMLNGDRLPTADEDDPRRVFQFEVLPSELLDYVSINRTITPDLEGDNIGGVVNFSTRSAVDKNTVKFSAGVGYSAMARKPLGSGSLLLGYRSKDKRFGIVANASYFGRNWSEHAYELEYESPFNHGISELKLKRYSGFRQTLGFNIAMEYKPNERFTIDIKGILGDNTNDKYQTRTNYNWSEGSGSRVRLHNQHGILRRTFLGANVNMAYKFSTQLSTKLHLASYDNSFRYGNVPYSDGDPRNGYFSVTYISPLLQYYDRDYIDLFGNPANANDPDAFLTKLIGGDNPYGRGDDYRNVQPHYGNFVDSSALTTSDFTFYQAASELNKTHEQDPIVVQNDWTYRVSSQLKLVAGFKYRYKKGSRELSIHRWQVDFQNFPTTPRPLTNAQTYNSDPNDDFLSSYGTPYSGTFQPFLTHDYLNNFVQNLGDTLRNIPMDKLNQEYVLWAGSKYYYHETVVAGYIMADGKIGDKLAFVGGIRLENTKLWQQSDTLDTQVTLDTASSTYYYKPLARYSKQSNLAILPSANFTYTPTPLDNIRFAISRTFHRPNFAETKPGFASITYEDLDFTFGNARLRPTYSLNFDLAWEHFWGNKGMVSIGGYYKYVTDHIFLKTTEEYDPIQDIGFKRYDNAGNSYVLGAEFTINRQLDFLPGVLGGLGINANIAFSLSRMSVPGRPSSQAMSGQTPLLYNFGLFYEKYGIMSRIALNYTGPFLKELNLAAIIPIGGTVPELVHKDTDFDLFQGDFYSLDLSVGYRFDKHASIFVEASNLLDYPSVDYIGKRERPHRTGFYKPRAQLVFRYTL